MSWRAALAALALLASGCASSAPAEPPSFILTRIGDAPPDIVAQFAEASEPVPTTHIPTAEERALIAEAFASLTPLHRRMLEQHLNSISFLDGLPNNALTAPAAEPGQFNIIMRAGVLRETASELLTNKERTCFDSAGSGLSISIDAGNVSGVTYALLHEATHVADAVLRISSTAEQGVTPFSEGVWTDRVTIAPAYRGEVLPALCYRRDGAVMSVERAQGAYEELSRTPFASLYASANWFDDVAELTTWRHITERLGQPYRLEVRRSSEVIYRYEPMRAELVRGRLSLLDLFYEE